MAKACCCTPQGNGDARGKKSPARNVSFASSRAPLRARPASTRLKKVVSARASPPPPPFPAQIESVSPTAVFFPQSPRGKLGRPKYQKYGHRGLYKKNAKKMIKQIQEGLGELEVHTVHDIRMGWVQEKTSSTAPFVPSAGAGNGRPAPGE